MQPITGIVDIFEAGVNMDYSVCVCPSCGTTVTRIGGGGNCIAMLCPACGTSLVSPRSVFAWRELVFRPLVIGSLIVVVLALAAHYLIFGARQAVGESDAAVVRFLPIETASHFALLFSFVILAVTGMTGIIGPGANISGSLGGGLFLLLHYIAAAGFTLGLAATCVLWFHDAAFNKGDVEWIRRGGGYFGYTGELPAGRFNAGQKVFFWFACFLGVVLIVTGLIRLFPVSTREIQQAAYMTHDVVALLLIIGVLAHIYMSTGANLRAWHTLFTGSMTEEQARAHHPDWAYETAGTNPTAHTEDFPGVPPNQEGL